MTQINLAFQKVVVAATWRMNQRWVERPVRKLLCSPEIMSGFDQGRAGTGAGTKLVLRYVREAFALRKKLKQAPKDTV